MLNSKNVSGHVTARGFDSLERRHQLLGADQRVMNPDALAIVPQMRRGKHADPMAGSLQDGSAISAHRALAVGARHGDHRDLGLLPAQAALDLPQPVESQVNGPRVHLRLVGQPLLETPGTAQASYAAAGSLPVIRRSMAPMRSRSSRRSTIMSRAPCSSRNSLR